MSIFLISHLWFQIMAKNGIDSNPWRDILYPIICEKISQLFAQVCGLLRLTPPPYYLIIFENCVKQVSESPETSAIFNSIYLNVWYFHEYCTTWLGGVRNSNFQLSVNIINSEHHLVFNLYNIYKQLNVVLLIMTILYNKPSSVVIIRSVLQFPFSLFIFLKFWLLLFGI